MREREREYPRQDPDERERESYSCSFVVVKRQRVVSAFVLVHNEIWDILFL